MAVPWRKLQLDHLGDSELLREAESPILQKSQKSGWSRTQAGKQGKAFKKQGLFQQIRSMEKKHIPDHGLVCFAGHGQID